MPVVMDIRMAGKGGIGTYISQLKARLDVEPINFSAPLYSIREQLAYLATVPKCDLFFSPHMNVPLLPTRAKKQVTTVHDVFHLDHGDHYPLRKRLAVKQLYKKAIRGSDLVITVSEFSKGRILHHFPMARVEVIELGADHLLGIEPQAVEGVPERFYLFVGTLKPHKNRKLLEGLPIVDVLGQHSEAELVWLYKQAEALIFPSLYEGFGLPPLEAMSLGCPVVASHAASIPEVCGDAALYFDPKDHSDLKRAVEQLNSERDKYVERGQQRSLEMKWSECAKRHHSLFSRFVNVNDFMMMA